MITIQVLSKSSGKPVSGAKVHVVFNSFLRGFIEGQTNSEGIITFNVDNGAGKISVNGNRIFDGEIKGKMVFHI